MMTAMNCESKSIVHIPGWRMSPAGRARSQVYQLDGHVVGAAKPAVASEGRNLNNKTSKKGRLT
jgi:hypothetical protein